MALIKEKTTIYLTRHCPYANPRGIIPFQLPGVPLSPEGKVCAKKLGRWFKSKHISAIYASSLLRCRQTATTIGSYLNLKPHFSKLLIDTRTPFQGMTRKEFDRRGGVTFANPYHQQHGGETIDQLYTRARRVFDQALRHSHGRPCLIVSHADPIMVLLHHFVLGDANKYLHHDLPQIPMGGVVKLVISTPLSSAADIRVGSYSYHPAPPQTVG